MKNKIRLVLGDTAVMELTQGKLCMVDVADLEMLGKYRWCYAKSKGGKDGYPVTTVGNKIIRMHALLMGVSSRSINADHKSRNKMDNRRENLRIANSSQNCGNVGKKKNNSSGYKGVYWSKSYGKWRASIEHKDKGKISLGVFSNIEDAARAYDVAAVARWGEFAFVNIPLPEYVPASA